MSAKTKKHTHAMGYAKIHLEVFIANVLMEHMEILPQKEDVLLSRIPSQVRRHYVQHIILSQARNLSPEVNNKHTA